MFLGRALSTTDIHEYEFDTINKFSFNTVKMHGWQPDTVLHLKPASMINYAVEI